jgi:Holliday junction resolvase RusA-like endonuclease
MPCPRPRVTRQGFAYMPKTYTAWKRDFVRLFPRQSHGTPLAGPLKMFCAFSVSCPPSYSKKERQAALDGSRWPRPDVDNLVKSVADALTELGVWGDDSQVVELQVTKCYGEADGIRITIEQAKAASGRGCAARPRS